MIVVKGSTGGRSAAPGRQFTGGLRAVQTTRKGLEVPLHAPHPRVTQAEYRDALRHYPWWQYVRQRKDPTLARLIERLHWWAALHDPAFREFDRHAPPILRARHVL